MTAPLDSAEFAPNLIGAIFVTALMIWFVRKLYETWLIYGYRYQREPAIGPVGSHVRPRYDEGITEEFWP